MAEKNIKSRIVHKHDTAEHWSLATGFIPKQGEIIVYDIDGTYTYERIKIGDGVTNVNSLPFYTDEISEYVNTKTGELQTSVNNLNDLVGDTPVSAQISSAVENKVDKVDGKGLSTNDYTTAEKDKLAGIATGANNYSHPTGSGNNHIPAGGSSGQILRWSSSGTAAWGSDNNTTYNDMGGATSSAAGTHGLVPAPAKGDQEKYLRGDGTWGTPASIPTNHASSATTYGVSSASNYGHAKASATTPKANGTAAVGSETSSFARGDHIHPLQTTISGNAGTSTKLANARTLTIGGTGKTFDGSGDVSWSLSEIGATVSNTITGGTTKGPTIKTTVNGVEGSAVTIPSASLTASGTITTGAQEFGGLKTFHGARLKIDDNASKTSLYYNSNSGTILAETYVSQGDNTNITEVKYCVRLRSPNSTPSTSTTGKSEFFIFPVPDAGRTADVYYNVLTTKNTITVPQGGTGASNKSDARTNLGITSGTTLPDASNSAYSSGDIFILY